MRVTHAPHRARSAFNIGPYAEKPAPFEDVGRRLVELGFDGIELGARQHGAKETLPGGQLEFIKKLSGRINHIHLIDRDNSCHKDAAGNDETSAHAPFGDG